jgi:phenylpropionate dioxygenase-like ring-hydroxylating dioxygenase large terminal subunit
VTLTFKAAQRASEPLTMPLRRFARNDVVCEGWYVVASSRSLARGRVTRVWIGTRDLVVYRDLSGTVRATDRACPHLGADLANGTVVVKGLQCAFHQWCWGTDGRCVAGGGVASGARLATYEVRERWGLIWVWAGTSPAYELPMPEPENRAHVLRLPSQRLGCHPHVVLGNGLDLTHVVPVHRFRFVEDPAVEPEPPHRLSVHVHVKFQATVMRHLLGLASKTARWTFTNIGPSLAWVRVIAPTPFELLWAARPLPDGGCATNTLFFLPRWRSLVRGLPMMIATTWADRGVLEGLEFQPGFVPSDAVFAQYAGLVDALPEWKRRE